MAERGALARGAAFLPSGSRTAGVPYGARSCRSAAGFLRTAPGVSQVLLQPGGPSRLTPPRLILTPYSGLMGHMTRSIPFPQNPDGGFARLPLPPECGLSAGLSLRSAGDMIFSPERDSPARLSLYRRLGVAPERVACVHQIHSRTVFRVASRGEAAGLEGDGLVTGNPELVLGVTVADCLPVFLYTLDGAAFGVVHSGWKGTGIAAEAVRRIGTGFGVPPDRIGAVLGPCIGSCCYNVPEDRAEQFSREWGDDAVRHADGTWYLDLVRANVRLLEREGVSRISAANACTVCTDALGSFRREGPQRFTRMLALIGRF